MPTPIKPIKIVAPGAVKPVGVQPVAPKAPQQVAQQTQSQDNGFNQLFGTAPIQTPAPAVTPTKEEKHAEIKQAVQQVEAGNGEKTGAKVKEQKKAASKNKGSEEESTKKKEYTGPRQVKVYGQLLFTEEDPKVTLEAIRQRIVNEYGYDEFSASRTTMSLDEETGIVVPQISFQKKG